jgi:hypothetical protein
VHFRAAASLNLRAADHGLGTIILRDKANSKSARDAFVDCRRVARVSIRALLFQLLAIIAIIGTFIAIIRKHSTATWIGIYCANQAMTSDSQARLIHPVPLQVHTHQHRQNRSSYESQPSLSHGRMELISQIFNLFCNCSTFIDPSCIRNTEISENLSTKCNKHNNSNNINKQHNSNKHNNSNKNTISTIIAIKQNNHNNHNDQKYTCSPCNSIPKIFVDQMNDDLVQNMNFLDEPAIHIQSE